MKGDVPLCQTLTGMGKSTEGIKNDNELKNENYV
jgi:hypothetical protein